MDANIIIVDDDKNLRTILAQSISRSGARVRATATLETLRRWLGEGEGDVVLCDVNLLDGDAIEALPRLKAIRPELPFIMMSAQNTILTALRSSEVGAFDYLAKPFDLKDMLALIAKALEGRARMRSPDQNEAAQQGRPKKAAQAQSWEQTPSDMTAINTPLPMIGRSEAMQELYRQISHMHASDWPVLISGESGTGKTLAAHVLHQAGPRASEPYIRFDGYADRVERVEMAFREAKRGVLALENVDEFLPSEQQKILSIFESADYPCRIIAISNDGISRARREGRFREDLYYRLNVLRLHLPPLHERAEDIEELAAHFLAPFGGKYLGEDALLLLKTFNWPGNLGALKAVLIGAATLGSGKRIGAGDIEMAQKARHPGEEMGEGSAQEAQHGFGEMMRTYMRRLLRLHDGSLPGGELYSQIIEQVDRPIIEAALAHMDGNQIKTAELLGINRNTLRKKINNLDISVTKGKKLM